MSFNAESLSLNQSQKILYKLIFVEDIESSDAFKQAFEKARDCGLDPVVLSVQDCLRDIEPEDKIYIISNFESPVFPHLRDFGCSILGPMALLASMENLNKNVVQREIPAYNLIMRPCIVSFSGLDLEMKKLLSDKVTFMGGRFTGAITKSVTHLVTETVNSVKYQVANENSISCMLPQWINIMYEDRSLKPKPFNDLSYDIYKLLPFHGLTISISGIEGNNRSDLVELIENNGGQYSGGLKKGSVTHLVVSKPSGRKFECAVSWKIICLKPEWVHDSVLAGYSLKVDNFTVSPPEFKVPGSSTPTKKTNKTICDSMMLANLSTVSAATAMNNTQGTHFGDISIASVDIGEETNISDINISLLEELNAVQIEKLMPNKNLEGCRILLMGFSQFPDIVIKLGQLINLGGGTNIDEMNSTVTHIILPCDKIEDLTKLENLTGKVCTVSWLINTVQNTNKFPKQDLSVTTLDKDGTTIQENDENAICPNEEVSFESDIFRGISFSIHDGCFSEDEVETIQNIVMANSGIMSEKAIYIVVPSITFENHFNKANHVTDFWVKMCHESVKAFPLDENFLFKPVVVLRKVKVKPPLMNCVLTLSQFSPLERDTLTNLAHELGAVCQEYLCKKLQESKKVLANTHLVLKETTGKKYEAAVSWKIKVVSSEWLYATAVGGERMVEEKFQPLTIDAEFSQLKNTSVEQTSDVQINDNLSSKSSGPPTSDQLEVKESVKDDKPTECLGYNTVEFNYAYFGLDPNNLEDSFETSITKNLSKRLNYPEDLIPVMENACKPLCGVTIFTSSKLKKQQVELYKISKNLGGSFRFTYEEAVTHVIHQGKSNEQLPIDVKRAQQLGRLVVSPEWLHECQKENALINENLFPYNYNRRLSLINVLSQQITPSPAKDTNEPPNKVNETTSFKENTPIKDLKSTKDNTVENGDQSAMEIKSPNQQTINNEIPSVSDYNKHLKNFVSVAQAAKKETTLKQLKSATSTPEGVIRHRSFPKTETQPIELDQPEQSQVAPIIWVEDQAQENDYSRLPSYPTFSDVPIDTLYRKEQPERIFQFASFRVEELELMCSGIESLGGRCVHETNFNSSATHIIVLRLSKSEKMLSSIAAGKTIISKDFVTDSTKAERFLDEEQYVLGSPSYLKHYKPDEMTESTMKAVYRWRQRYTASGEGAFSDWCVLLLVTEKKMQVFSNVLKAGGATVVVDAARMIASKKRLAFVDVKADHMVNYEELMDAQIWCLQPDYMNHYLHFLQEPDMEKYVVEPAKAYISRIRLNRYKKQRVS